MGCVVYSMNVSADGYIADRDGDFSWGNAEEEIHRFHNDRTRELGAELYGRRLWETMVYWETIDPDGEGDEVERDFARAWKGVPARVVFSRTLERVEGHARLASRGVAEELAALREEVDGDVGVGGAGIAASLAEQDLIDEYVPIVNPVIVGGGTPFWPTLTEHLPLELVETRGFDGGLQMLRYRRVRS
jgi:dihydrofolate reductase